MTKASTRERLRIGAIAAFVVIALVPLVDVLLYERHFADEGRAHRVLESVTDLEALIQRTVTWGTRLPTATGPERTALRGHMTLAVESMERLTHALPEGQAPALHESLPARSGLVSGGAIDIRLRRFVAAARSLIIARDEAAIQQGVTALTENDVYQSLIDLLVDEVIAIGAHADAHHDTLGAAHRLWPFVQVIALVVIWFFLLRPLLERLRQEELGRADAETQARFERTRFEDFARSASDWFWEQDADLRFTFMSERVGEHANLDVQLHIGRLREEIGVRTTGAVDWKSHAVLLANRQPFRDFVYYRDTSDGERIWLSTRGVPVFDNKGEFCGYRGLGRTVTELVEAQRRVAQERATFEGAMESLSDGFALFDTDDRLVFCNTMFKQKNPGLAPILKPGLTFEEMVRDNVENGWILDAVGREEDFIRERVQAHQAASGEAILSPRRDGQWLLVREQRMSDGSIFLVNTDLTELKRQEQVLRASHKELMELEERLNVLDRPVEATTTGIVITRADDDMPIVYLNPAFQRMTGYSSAEVVGSNCRLLQGGVRDEDQATEIREVLAAGGAFHSLVKINAKMAALSRTSSASHRYSGLTDSLVILSDSSRMSPSAS